MKKLLLALGATVAFGFAQAQSNVTVYGLIDAGFMGTNYKGTGTSTTTNQTTSAFGNNAEAPSRLGFKGSEDLGSGTSAIFTLETGLNPANSTLSTFNTRQAFVGLKQNGLGSATVGTQYTPIHNEVAVTDAGGQNLMVGSLIYASNLQANGNSGAAPYAAASSSGEASDGYTVRTANTFTLISEKINGFGAQGFVTANNQNTTQTSATTGGINNNNGWGLGFDYQWKKLYATAAYQALRSNQTGTLTSPTPAIWSTASGGVNTQDNQTYVAATYDFGTVKGYAQWVNRKVTDTLNTSYFGSRSAQQLGVRGFWTPTIESWASIGNGKLQSFGVGQPTANFTGYQLGTNYWLSKRTNLYGIFGSVQTNTIDVSANGYALGIKHTF